MTEQVKAGETLVADLSSVPLDGPSGVAWGLDSPQLNANLVTIAAGDGVEAHNNDEVDVLLIVSSGRGELVIDEQIYALASHSVVLIPRGSTRSIRSIDRLIYYSVHARRPGLGLTKR